MKQSTKILLLIIAGAVLTSCQAYKRKICLSCATNTVIKDSVSVKETVKYDTTYVSISGPTITIKSPCDSLGNLKPFKQTKTVNGVRQVIEGKDNTITAKCDIDSLLQVNKELTKEISRFHSVVKEVPRCDIDHRTRFDGFTYWWFWITASILGGYLVYRVVRAYFFKR